MQKELNTIKTALEAAGCTVTAHDTDDNVYAVVVSLGNGWAGDYKGGYWGDCAITDDALEMHFNFGDVYGDGEEIACGEGFVHLTYKGGCSANGLAYTGDLEQVVTQRIKDLYGFNASGSEQGMQGEDYLSLDIFEDAA